MPNYVTNKVYITPESEFEAISKFVLTPFDEDIEPEQEGNAFDLEKIIPTPKELNEGTSPFSKREDETEEEATERKRDYLKRFGSSDWYSWRLTNWGTKWNTVNASFIDGPEGYFEFDTAWSTPSVALIKLSKKFPKATIRVQYADEDIGNNCGEYLISNGEILEEEEGDVEFACEVRGYEMIECKKCGKKMPDFEEDLCYECQDKEGK